MDAIDANQTPNTNSAATIDTSSPDIFNWMSFISSHTTFLIAFNRARCWLALRESGLFEDVKSKTHLP